MTYAILAEFHDAIARASDDDDRARRDPHRRRGHVLRGHRPVRPRGHARGPAIDGRRGGRGSAARCRGRSSACPKPVIGAIDGAAVGMGAEFATQCDIRIASTRARFGWIFVQRGLVPDTGAGSFLLPRLIGPSAAMRLLFSGEIIDAAEALRLGFVTAVVEPDELPAAAAEEANRYLSASPFAVRRVKQLVYEAMARPVDEHVRRTAQMLEECFHSEDHREGVAAFLERREPKFTGH